MIHVKFCGIRRKDDIKAVNRLQPDFAGFVFAKSKRQVSKEQAAALKELLDPGIKTVAVLVNMPAEEAAILANSGIADLLQLHGDEDAAYIAKLRTLTRAKVIKAVRLRSANRAINAKLKTFSLSLLNSLLIDKPIFLAGGLDADNVAEIIEQIQSDAKLFPFFYGVDGSG